MNAKININNKMWVTKVIAVGMNKMQVTYANGTKEEMAKSVYDQVVREVKK